MQEGISTEWTYKVYKSQEVDNFNYLGTIFTRNRGTQKKFRQDDVLSGSKERQTRNC